MPDTTPRLYEGLFLMTQASITNGLDQAKDLVRGMLDRAGAEVLVLRRWDERKLAYGIAGQKRGTYLITYFRLTPTEIAGIERDVNLSEDVLRVLMTRCDHFGEAELTQIQSETEDGPSSDSNGDGDGEGAEAPAEAAAS